ncbi:type II toxin-antitoxin system Phd/YefM family antitoxin [Streptomyces sp. SID12501]|uniref:Type II toxin-antitoxin system Phd/YefM family antitoxin n=1 Tax=Streptomyces sp. SID12501 TaxID=2706042 RepID=A0A6B3BLT0_9ACTN|nr:type II toxin-antitoxin system Phd/YefM family antitoxin [Streptomyces sp. SID12501]NEC85322.1 type II toxin-antitoxin system Phd/YefM family antitoxin [Streptomyces sp. SID12501]
MDDVKIVVERRFAPAPIDYERLVSLVESTGERVVLTDADVPVSVLFPAGTVAELEHWARADYPVPAPIPHEEEEDDADDMAVDVGRLGAESSARPQEYGTYTRYVRADGRRASFTRGGMVVAVQLTADEAAWLKETAMYVRQGYMDPNQSAAFVEFLARQPPAGDR